MSSTPAACISATALDAMSERVSFTSLLRFDSPSLTILGGSLPPALPWRGGGSGVPKVDVVRHGSVPGESVAGGPVALFSWAYGALGSRMQTGRSSVPPACTALLHIHPWHVFPSSLFIGLHSCTCPNCGSQLPAQSHCPPSLGMGGSAGSPPRDEKVPPLTYGAPPYIL